MPLFTQNIHHRSLDGPHSPTLAPTLPSLCGSHTFVEDIYRDPGGTLKTFACARVNGNSIGIDGEVWPAPHVESNRRVHGRVLVLVLVLVLAVMVVAVAVVVPTTEDADVDAREGW